MPLMSPRIRGRHAAVTLILATVVVAFILVTRLQSLSSRPADGLAVTLVSYKNEVRKNRAHGDSARVAPHQPTSREVFRQRQVRLQASCPDSPMLATLKPPFQYGIMNTGHIAYCPTPKSGSTVWKRILYYIDRKLNASFLDVEYGDIHGKTMYMFEQTYSHPKPDRDMNSVVFVREPYSRLFAGYLDKLFTPRQSNWRRYARPVLRHSRKYASKRELACASDVTFAEFLQYYVALESGQVEAPRDEHFAPQWQLCGFCQRHYDFVGHQESFADDTLGILAHLNLSGLLSYADFTHEYSRYEMNALIRYTFSNELDGQVIQDAKVIQDGKVSQDVKVSQDGKVSKVSACMSREEALRRLWKVLQVRGCLSSKEFFPFTPEDCHNMAVDLFLKMAMQAFERSLADPDRKSNYQAAMMEAYSSVSARVRRALRDVLWKDFLYFGYDSDNPVVFPANDTFVLSDYRYFDVFDAFLFDTVDEFDVKFEH